MNMGIVDFVRRWTLPSAIVTGAVCYGVFAVTPALDEIGDRMASVFDVLFPFSVFATLFVTFSKVNFHKMMPRRWHLWTALMQMVLVGGCVSVILLTDMDADLRLTWEAVLTCVIAPCASAAPVVTGKLGGDINGMTTFTLLSSLLCAVTIPLVFPMVEKAADVTFVEASLTILEKLAMVMLLPLALGWIVRHYVHSVYRYIMRHPNLGFYCWSVSLAITTGITLKNIVHSEASGWVLIWIAAGSMLVCLMQFAIGRLIGRWQKEIINCGQGMFQKNTAMAIWVSYMYLNPVASIGAGCYVLWQNIVNSMEISRKMKETGMN